MKKIIIKFSLIILALITFSCEDMLDVTIRSSITGENFWKSEGDFEPYMIGIYNRYRSHYDYFGFGEDRSEMWKQGRNNRFTPAWSHNMLPGNTVDWTGYYGTIGHCNLLLEKMEAWQFSNTTLKNRIMAETHAMRAAMYFLLARVWGDVPLVLTSVKDENEPLYPRSPVAEVFAQINTDINKALALFPEAGYVDKYRWSKPAVYALLADVKMWSGKVLNGGAADFTAAVNAISEVEKSGVSMVTSSYGTVFDSRKNGEIIFSLYLNRAEFISGAYTNCLPRVDNTTGGNDALPISLVGQSSYVLSDMALGLFQKYPEDKRISRTFLPEYQLGNIIYYWPNKFIGTRYADDRIPDSDFIVYRLSDLLLLKAEAYAALNQIDNALLNLNKVRQRAGIPAFSETNKALVEREILDERGRELFNEMKRWWDLVRAHRSGVIDIYQYIPNLRGKATPVYWPVHTNVLAKNSKLEQNQGYN